MDYLNAILCLHDYTRLLCLVEVFIFQIKKINQKIETK